MRNALARLSPYQRLGLIAGACLLVAAILIVLPSGTHSVLADSVGDAQKGLNDTGAVGKGQSVPQLIKDTLNLLSFIVGAASVIMLIIGGMRYVLSGGDSNAISSAKNTIIYAMVGLAITLFAQIIVLFVIGKVTQ
ncbi:MAG TPA: hypothetical protein VGS28_01730 [Candidatus Saccharimonadales bacterium]|nr:hypothetical protein [Candidatus Saccharimonadales bacterium]